MSGHCGQGAVRVRPDSVGRLPRHCTFAPAGGHRADLAVGRRAVEAAEVAAGDDHDGLLREGRANLRGRRPGQAP